MHGDAALSVQGHGEPAHTGGQAQQIHGGDGDKARPKPAGVKRPAHRHTGTAFVGFAAFAEWWVHLLPRPSGSEQSKVLKLVKV